MRPAVVWNTNKDLTKRIAVGLSIRRNKCNFIHAPISIIQSLSSDLSSFGSQARPIRCCCIETRRRHWFVLLYENDTYLKRVPVWIRYPLDADWHHPPVRRPEG